MDDTLYSIFSSLPFCLCLFWWVLLMLRSRAISYPAHRYLCHLALTAAVLYFCHAVFFSGEEIPFLRVVYTICHLAVFPLFWLYIRALTEPDPLTFRASWVLAPALLAGVVLGVALVSGGAPGVLDLPIEIVFLLELVLVLVAVLLRLTAYEYKVQNFYVDTERKSVRGLRLLSYLLIPVTVLSALGSVLGRNFFLDRLLVILPSLLFSVLLYGVFYLGLLSEYTAVEMEAGASDAPVPEEEEPADDNEPANQALLESIRELMETQRMYLQPGLKITDVAEALETNRTYISATINSETGMSFSDYVNGFRVRHAQALLLEKEQGLTLNEIGHWSGFAGDTSFFRNFKKATGQTPSEWLSSQRS